MRLALFLHIDIFGASDTFSGVNDIILGAKRKNLGVKGELLKNEFENNN